MYRLITEDLNPEGIHEILVKLGMDYTSYPASGSWKGQKERSLVIEIETPSSSIFQAAKEIAERFGARFDCIAGDDLVTRNFPSLSTTASSRESKSVSSRPSIDFGFDVRYA